jgi:hypothetical protein
MKRIKPTVGDLVRLDKLAQDELDAYGQPWANVGLVVECVGIRCKVDWTNGVTTRPMRSVLEVINESR